MSLSPLKRGNPCPICDSSDGRCRDTGDRLILCMVEVDGGETPGYTFIGRTKDDAWGKWLQGDKQAWTQEAREQWRRDQDLKRQQRAQHEARLRAAALPAVERDRHYRQLLNALNLHPDDRADLIRRGLDDTQIQRWGVKSVGQWQRVGFELPTKLPGVNLDGRSLNVSNAGYLCPVRDIDGLIVAFQIRLRESDGGRYRWLTGKTKKLPNGATPHAQNGELPLAIFLPRHLSQPMIALVEGTGAKPSIACDRFGCPVVGAAGGQWASSPQTLRESLDRLSAEVGGRSLLLVPDAGVAQNSSILRQYRQVLNLAQSWGYELRILWWGQVSKDALDIDELPLEAVAWK